MTFENLNDAKFVILFTGGDFTRGDGTGGVLMSHLSYHIKTSQV